MAPTQDNGEMPPPKRRRTESIVSDATQHREVGSMRKQRGRSASFVGSASGIHFVKSVYNAVGQTSPDEAHSPRQDLVPGEEDQLPNAANQSDREKLWRPGEIGLRARGHQVAFEDMLRWSQSYFDHWHPVLPFLHAPSFLEWCEIVSQRPLDEVYNHLSPHQMVILRSVFSTSIMDRRQIIARLSGEPVPHQLVFESFHDAITSVQTALVSAPSVESLQAAVSVQLFLISMLRHNAASRVGGIILRLLFQMGMHRCPYRYSAFSREDCVLRQRVFWSVYCLDRYICQSLGIPLTLRDDDIDVCMLDHEQHMREGDTSYATDPRLTLLCLCAKQSQIKGHVLELCNKSIDHRNFDMKDVGRVRTMVAKWSNDVESTLDSIAGSSSSLDPLHQLMLDVLKDESIIALNRPLLTGARSSESYCSALQACISSSRSIIKSLGRYAVDTPLVWPSFTWAAWMSGFIVLYAAVEGELALTVALSLVDQCTSVLDNLSARDTVWPKTCSKVVRDLAERVRQGASVSGKGSGSASSHGQGETEVSDATQPDAESAAAPQWIQGTGQYGFSQDFFSNVLDQDPGATDLFRGFDIPFWLGDDQYANVTNDGWA